MADFFMGVIENLELHTRAMGLFGKNWIISDTMAILAFMCALAATVACFIFFILKKRSTVTGGMRVAHDIFNFKQMYIEVILKVIYVFTTALCIFGGFFMLFGYNEDHYDITTFGEGLGLMILGPIILRITFELLMMFVQLVKNVAQINKKLGGDKIEETPEPVREVPYKFCGQCGTRCDKNAAVCPCCGNRI